MKVVRAELPQELQTIELHTFADFHIGDKRCVYKEIMKRIEYVASTLNAYCVVNGDLLNNATTTSISNSYEEQLTPMQQIKKGVELLTPIKNKILAITTGNHEQRTYKKEGIELSEIMARELGLGDIFDPDGIVLFVRFGTKSREKSRGRKMQYSLYMTHGSGGGRKAGAKAARLEDMTSIVDTDVYIHSHTHLPMIMKQAFARVYYDKCSIEIVDKLFINTSATLEYGGYSQQYEFKIPSIACPVIRLDGAKREMTATL